MAMETAGTVVNKYYRGANGMVYGEISGTVSYYLKDAHGDTTALADAAGTITKNYLYDAFGNEQTEDAADTNPFRYSGEYFDAESGNIYLRNRYYDASTGRFITEDPIQDGTNWYVYAGNNPIMFMDPWGLEKSDDERSPEAQVYIDYYQEAWKNFDALYQSAANIFESALAMIGKEIAHQQADNIRALDEQGKITGIIYDIKIFTQGRWKLCWAYCQVMIENFQMGMNMTQTQADTRAQQIAESIYGTGKNPDGSYKWNRGGWPTNSRDVKNQRESLKNVENFSDLMRYLLSNPIYAYYNNGLPASNQKSAAHLIVVTGTVSAPGHPDLVTSNNPWGDKNIQTYNDFVNEIPGDSYGMKLVGVLRL